MDVEQLHIVLQQSFSADSNVRKPAEETIRNLKNLPGSVQLLLQVAAETQVRFEVRQASAIQLKNICREGWAERIHYTPYPAGVGTTSGSTSGIGEETVTKPSLLSDDDKESTKNQLVQALLKEPEKSIRDLLAETLQTIVIHDFPDKWNNLIPLLLEKIRVGVTDMDQHGLQVHNALVAIRKVAKRYEYKSKEQRGPLNNIVDTAFPLLLPLAQLLCNPNQHSIEAAMMLKQILKIFWSCTQFYLPGTTDTTTATTTTTTPNSTTITTIDGVDISTPTPIPQAALSTLDNKDKNTGAIIGLSRPEQLQPWFDLLTTSLKKPLPEASTGLEPRGQPIDIDSRNAWPWWKVKKWAVQIMSRLFSRYGIPAYADDQQAKEFALYFSTIIAPQFLSPVCETLNLRPTGQFCTDRVVHLCLTYVDLAVELASTYKLLKPHLEFLMYQVCFPTMLLNEEDIDCFDNDPIEFVQKQNSPLADFYDPRMSAVTLITDLVKHRGQDVTQNLLGRMTAILQTYASAPPDQKNHVEKDGALLTFGSLAKYLLAKEKYANEIEGLLVSSVFPEFESPIAFLRYRSCWMIRSFSGVKWTDDGTYLRTLLEKVLNRLSDPALPVQIEASKALRFLIEADGAEATLLPVLPQLLNEYFRIMNEIGNDEVVQALQVLLDKFGEHIEPHAVTLVTQLSNAFYQYCTAGEDEDDDDAALAAAQCLECIATVLKGICQKESILISLEPILMPLVLKILGNDGEFIEYLECGLDVLTFLTFFQTTLSPEVWQAFPLIYLAFDQWAYDYLNMMVPCLQSYIAKSPDVFLSGRAQLPEGVVPYIDLVSSMVAKTVANDRASEVECRYAFSLFMSVLHHCPGKVDAYIPFINEVSLGKLGQQVNIETSKTRVSIYQVLGSALYYQPQLELIELEKRGVTQQVLGKWIQDSSTMDRWLPRKLTVLGFSSILQIPMAALPPSVTSLVPLLLETTVRITIALKEDSEKVGTDDTPGTGGKTGRKNKSDDAIDDDDDIEDDDDVGDVDQGFDENQDVTNEVDEAYRKALSGATNWEDDMSKFLLGEWDEDGEDIDEEYSSPTIDPIEELILVSDTLQMAFTREPDAYKQVQNALNQECINAVQFIFTTAESMRTATVQAQATAAAAVVAAAQLQASQQASQQS